jgi:pyruvate dehydrogenase E1 component
VASTVFSVTSYPLLRRDALECERFNRLHPQAQPRVPYLEQVFGHVPGPIIAASDYVRAVPELIAPFLAGRLLALGTDGFGRSDTRKALRRFFEIDAEHITVAALYALARRGEIERALVQHAIESMGVAPDAPPPWSI